MRSGATVFLMALLALFLLTIPLSVIAGNDATESRVEIYEQFRNPPKGYGLTPYWFWNGRITAEEARRQMRLMLEQGVSSAIVFPWDGMEIPFLSEAWWETLGESLDVARELGFTLNLNDDYDWPSCHAWDPNQQGPELSRVLAGNPEYRMRTLAVEEISLEGMEHFERSLPQEVQAAIVGRSGPEGTLEPDSMRAIAPEGGKISWEVPEGRWRAFIYTLVEVTGAHNTRVDCLNPAAVRKYLDLVYEPLARRFPEHLGTTLQLTTADHEGTMGVHPIYTPGFWEVFQKEHGYDLRPMLPLLAQPGEGRAQEVRCDYFETVSELFRTSFVHQVTAWCEAHGFQHAASFYEEQMAVQIERAGDMFGIWRTTSAIEIDALLERARIPIDFKEAVSVAHFEKKKLLVENQGLQGSDSYLSPEKMRLGSNMALLWGADTLVPYFEYDPRKVQWPPQWFLGQPFRSYFHHYADTVRRIAFMNSRGAHIAPIALYYPLENAWAHGESRFLPHHHDLECGNEMDDTQAYYSALQLELSRNGWDYHILDAYYLGRAGVRDSALHLADESFRVMILPPLSTLSRDALRKLAEFFDAGGVILAIGELPTSSLQIGKDDPVILELVRHIFGEDAYRGGETTNRGTQGGTAHFFPCRRYSNFMKVLEYTEQIEVPAEYRQELKVVFDAIGRHLHRELEVVGGDSTGIYASHRVEGDTHFYWVVNDSDREREVTALVRETGTAQFWDPATGNRSLAPARRTSAGTEVDVTLDPWGGMYLVLSPSVTGVAAEPRFETVAAVDLTENAWRVTPEAEEVLVPYARVRPGAQGEGERSGWQLTAIDPSGWKEEWLAVENLSNPSWYLTGPFSYGDHEGYGRVFTPEEKVDLNARYLDDQGVEFGWVYKTSPTYWVNARELLGIPPESVVYAYTDVYSPTAREGRIRVAFADSLKLWWNGQEKMAIHRHPKWVLLRDPWSEQVSVKVDKGWNRVLLKVCRSENRPISFLFRIADGVGNTLKDLIYAPSREEPPIQETQGETWFRVEAPPGTEAVVVPPFEGLRRIYLNDVEVKGASGERIPFDGVVSPLLAFCCGPRERLERPIRFLGGSTEMKLESWNRTPLAHYSGRATYETAFNMPRLNPDEQVELDCGSVGVAAEAWVNGNKVGERVWRPYRFDITAEIHEGTNNLKVIVASSDANWLAQGDPLYPVGTWGLAFESERDRIGAIEPCGLVGPVALRIRRSQPASQAAP